MPPLRLGRRAPLLAAAATLTVAAFAQPAGASASTPEPVKQTCTLTESTWDRASGITLCHEGFEIQIVQRHADGRVSGRINAAGGWDPFITEAAASRPVKAVVVLIGANNYG